MKFFPQPDKARLIKFLLAGRLEYGARMAVIASLLAAGLLMQCTFSFWTGLVLLAAASLLGIADGYEAAPEEKSAERWECVTPDEYSFISAKAAGLRRWEEDLFDITLPRGAAAFATAAALCATLYAVLASSFDVPGGAWKPAALDAAAVLCPLWFSGVRKYLRKDALVVKTELLAKMMDRLAPLSEVQVFPMLALARTEKGAWKPEDAKVMVKFVGAPAALRGMQILVDIDRERGRNLPSLYCALVAEPGSGLLSGGRKAAVEKRSASAVSAFLSAAASRFGPAAVVTEERSGGDADILVIRRDFGKRRPRRTSESDAGGLVSEALKLAGRFIAAAPRA